MELLSFINKLKVLFILFDVYIYNLQLLWMSNVKLPPISTTPAPFKVPNDNEILLENDNGRSRNKQQKIWSKTTASCRNPLRRFDKFETAVDDKYVPINNYNNKEKKLIDSALQIIQVRKKNKDLVGKNSTIVQILEQKKEMFLVTMTHGIIEKQINNLKNQADQREKALVESNQMLNQDTQDFDRFQENEKNLTKNIEQKYERQVQKRLLIEQEIKSNQIAFNSLRAEKSRNEENISSYEKYKKFLNQLPPKEWINRQQEKKVQKLTELKNRMQGEWEQSNSKTGQTFDEYFDKLKRSGENQEIEQILNSCDMYFHEPHELIEYFNNLEQANLFCIQNVQIADQKLQQLKAKSQQHQKQLRQKYKSQQEHKNNLNKSLQQLQTQIKLQKKKKQQNSLLDGKQSSNIKAMIATEYKEMKELMTTAFLPEIDHNPEALSLLSGIEICMEKLWEKIREIHHENPKLVKQIKTTYEKNKTKEKREEAAKSSKEEQVRRKQRNMDKKEPTVKIVGRLDMKRSAPNDKLVKKKKEVKNKDENDDMHYLVE